MTLVIPLHPARVSLQSFFLYGNHLPLDFILLCTSDRAGKHFVTLFLQDVIDLAMLAANVVGQEVFGLEDGATEGTLEALHQVLVLLLNTLVEVTCTVAVQRIQRFGLSQKRDSLNEADILIYALHCSAL